MVSTRNCLVVACLLSVTVLVNCDESSPPPSGAPSPAPGVAPPAGQLPPITTGANVKDVLGDKEKGAVCATNAVNCCAAAGPADDACKTIATAVGNTSDPTCFAPKTCKFTVNNPVQTPGKSGPAYITTRDNLADYGVIFPCNNNQLVIVVPKKDLGSP
uniref:Secreted protein n=1 Tax=Cacopsylla melanoneura TaxID=428564 RepID=A0A8D8MH65_9HEMI